jgi:predicted DNA-binding ribbon-helix-helix protein
VSPRLVSTLDLRSVWRTQSTPEQQGMTAMKSLIVKHSVIIRGHKTSVSLEKAFWTALKEIADLRKITMTYLVSSIDSDRKHANVSSAIRLFVLEHYKVIQRRNTTGYNNKIAMSQHPDIQGGQPSATASALKENYTDGNAPDTH